MSDAAIPARHRYAQALAGRPRHLIVDSTGLRSPRYARDDKGKTARDDGGKMARDDKSRHCEERSDAAIFSVIASLPAGRQGTK